MAQCITCGSELHPDRAKKYDYCMSPECQRKNLKGLAMVAVGVNKSAEQYMLLDDQTRDELAAGKFADQRRALFGTSVPSSEPTPAEPPTATTPSRQATASRPVTPSEPPTATTPSPPATASRPVTPSQAASAVQSASTAQPSRPQPAGQPAVRPQPAARPRPARQRPPAPRPAARPAPRPWTKSQERLALLYNEQGLRPEEIAQKLGLTRYTVTQIILSSRNRAKL